ncbi:hypothetical protein [Roseomonas sp. BN140053]
MKAWIGFALERACDWIGQRRAARSQQDAREAQAWFRRAERWRQWRKGG